MKKGLKIGLAMSLIATAAIAAGVKTVYPSGTWRYKITVNIETPEGLKTGSAVREVHIQTVPNYNPQVPGVDVQVKGEAAVIDLGKRGKVFSLLRNLYGPDYAYDVVFTAFPGPPGFTPEGLKYYSHLKNAKAILKSEQYPMFVRFRDINDPKTVEDLYKLETYEHPNGPGTETRIRLKNDNFEKVFGKGVKLKSVEIEITDEPVTKKINKVLPPFSPDKGFEEWRKSLNYGDPLGIDRSLFERDK
jgi:hypothetical protein